MAQNVGPILEMVTEKYLLRCEAEWRGRQEALGILDEIRTALKHDDVRAIGAVTARNFQGPIQTIIPWASTYYTEMLIDRVRAEFGKNFWGFWMLGGMSGGGMGFIFAPEKKSAAQQRLQEIMSAAKRELQHALPFAMEPVVYDFAINESGTLADLLEGQAALMPQGYYALAVPGLLRQELHALSPLRRAELDKFGAACRTRPELRGMVQTLFDVLLPRGKTESASDLTLFSLLAQHGFDRPQHEQIRADLKEGRIGLAQNRLPSSAVIEDVKPEDVSDVSASLSGATVPVASVPPTVPVVEEATSNFSSATETVAATNATGTVAPLPFRAFDKSRPIVFRRRYLPHWRQEGATYFVTFRLADSLPDSVLRQVLQERDEWLRQHSRALTPEREQELKQFFREKLETELDKGFGACVLRETGNSAIIEHALRHFDGQRYWLGDFVVMPNHVHAIVRPIQNHDVSDIVHSWKSFTAHEINKRAGRKGQLWQHEPFDHIVRDEDELERFARYIQENPVHARLSASDYRLGHGNSVGGATVPVANVPPTVPVGERFKQTSSSATETVAGTIATGTVAPQTLREVGFAALRAGQVAVLTLAAGAGSRWTQGAGVVKALHPFCKLARRHRTFIETHLAKSRRVSRVTGVPLPHIFTTSYLTHEPMAEFLSRQNNYAYEGPLMLSPGKAVGLRMVPTVRDLRFAWEEMPQQLLDDQQQKVRDSLRAALIGWARAAGEASDYTDNVPLQCLHPVGHWYEVPNLFRNGVLAKLLSDRPQLKYLMAHNIDTLGADVDPALLGQHIQSGACLTFEVITRRIDDRGGGLARVNGRARLVEGLAMPREEAEFALSYYNSNTCWIDLDKLLNAFGLAREDLIGSPRGDKANQAESDLAHSPRQQEEADEKVSTAIRAMAAKMPTYITVKDVKKRWGHGQEDVFPVTQFEKLWVDMTALPEIDSRFVVVPRLRGQQLKDQAQLDGWLRDGSAAYVESLCEWS
jgi:REP element-mobilizing transposase RayT